jgi:hypothetical protein
MINYKLQIGHERKPRLMRKSKTFKNQRHKQEDNGKAELEEIREHRSS